MFLVQSRKHVAWHSLEEVSSDQDECAWKEQDAQGLIKSEARRDKEDELGNLSNIFRYAKRPRTARCLLDS